MAANAVRLPTLYYQIQQETIYYTVETDPIRKLVHALNIANLYRELSDLQAVIAARNWKQGKSAAATTTTSSYSTNSLNG